MKSFFTIPKPLGIAVIISALIYLTINIFLIKYPEFIDGGHQFGLITSRICLSIVSGYFLYVIVNQFKTDKEKDNLNDFISTRLENIYVSSSYFLSEAHNKTKYYTSFPPSKEEIQELLKILEASPDIKPSIVARQSKRYFTWFELIISEKQKTEEQIEILLKTSNNLDSELLKILGKIIDSEYFFWIDETKSFGRDYKQFSMFANFFYQYSMITNELFIYCYKKKYIKLDNEKHVKILKRIAKGEKISKEEAIKLSE